MAERIKQIDKYHQTKKGKIVFGVSELLIAYLMVSLAINSGSLWQYGLAILFFIGGINNLFSMLSSGIKHYGKTSPKKR